MVFVWGSLTELKEEKGTAQRSEEKGTATEGRKAEGRSTTNINFYGVCVGVLINILFSLEFEVKICCILYIEADISDCCGRPYTIN